MIEIHRHYMSSFANIQTGASSASDRRLSPCRLPLPTQNNTHTHTRDWHVCYDRCSHNVSPRIKTTGSWLLIVRAAFASCTAAIATSPTVGQILGGRPKFKRTSCMPSPDLVAECRKKHTSDVQPPRLTFGDFRNGAIGDMGLYDFGNR